MWGDARREPRREQVGVQRAVVGLVPQDRRQLAAQDVRAPSAAGSRRRWRRAGGRSRGAAGPAPRPGGRSRGRPTPSARAATCARVYATLPHAPSARVAPLLSVALAPGRVPPAGRRAGAAPPPPGLPRPPPPAARSWPRWTGSRSPPPSWTATPRASSRELRDQEYEARKSALEDLITERLLEKQAAARGVTHRGAAAQGGRGEGARAHARADPADLRPEPAPRGRAVREEVTPQIVASLKQQWAQERAQAYARELRDAAHGARSSSTSPAPTSPSPPTRRRAARRRRRSPSSSTRTTCARTASAPRRRWTRCSRATRARCASSTATCSSARPRSMAVARAALCAGDQGQFWEYRREPALQGRRLERPRPAGARDRAGPEAGASSAPASPPTATRRRCCESSEEGQKLGVSGHARPSSSTAAA